MAAVTLHLIRRQGGHGWFGLSLCHVRWCLRSCFECELCQGHKQSPTNLCDSRGSGAGLLVLELMNTQVTNAGDAASTFDLARMDSGEIAYTSARRRVGVNAEVETSETKAADRGSLPFQAVYLQSESLPPYGKAVQRLFFKVSSRRCRGLLHRCSVNEANVFPRPPTPLKLEARPPDPLP